MQFKNKKDQIDHYQNVWTNVMFSLFFLIKKKKNREISLSGFLEKDKVMRSTQTQNKNQSQLSIKKIIIITAS